MNLPWNKNFLLYSKTFGKGKTSLNLKYRNNFVAPIKVVESASNSLVIPVTVNPEDAER